MNPAFHLGVVLALACGFATAQNRTDASSPQVEFRVTRFDPTDQASPVFIIGHASGKVEVEVPLTYIGGPHKATLRDGRFLDLWRGNAELPEISLPIAGDERKDLLLVFIPAEQSFKVIKVNTPLSRIRGGDRFIINATNKSLALKSGGDKPVFIDSGKSGLLRGPGGGEILSVPVLISLKEESDDWKLASTENWQFDPRFRRYLFAYISPRTRQLTFHGVAERMAKTD
jgi:hypothetical protein